MSKHDLLSKLSPKVWQSEDFLHEDIGFETILRQLIVMAQDGGIGVQVTEWLNSQNACGHGVHASLPIHVG
jgi:hypothetical protein